MTDHTYLKTRVPESLAELVDARVKKLEEEHKGRDHSRSDVVREALYKMLEGGD